MKFNPTLVKITQFILRNEKKKALAIATSETELTLLGAKP